MTAIWMMQFSNAFTYGKFFYFLFQFYWNVGLKGTILQ